VAPRLDFAVRLDVEPLRIVVPLLRDDVELLPAVRFPFALVFDACLPLRWARDVLDLLVPPRLVAMTASSLLVAGFFRNTREIICVALAFPPWCNELVVDAISGLHAVHPRRHSERFTMERYM
jgi:hypothetical protein